MSLHTIIVKSEKLISDNSPLILTGIGAAGVLTTAYLTGKSSIRAYQILEDHEINVKMDLARKEKFFLVWKEFIPPAGSAAVTIGAIILANRIGTRRAAALAVAYTVSERGFQEYREKVVEQIGKKKETAIRDEIAQDQVTRAGVSRDSVIIGGGKCIFMDARSGRTFWSEMEDVKSAINAINYKINGSVYASVNDFYEKVGLPRLPDGDDFGWTNALMDVHFTTTITDDNMPCFQMKFTVEPIRNYDKCFG